MAKKKEVKAEKPSKISNEELNKVQSVINNVNRAQLEIGSLESKKHNILHHISTCVLENMSVSYGGDRYKTFDPTEDGAPPVETSVTLAFKEMELITRERVHEGF